MKRIGLILLVSAWCGSLFADVTSVTLGGTAITNATASAINTNVTRGLVHRGTITVTGGTCSVSIVDIDGTAISNASTISGSATFTCSTPIASTAAILKTSGANTNGAVSVKANITIQR